jgi:hypothetical protein
MSIFTTIKNLFTLESRVKELEDLVKTELDNSKEKFTQQLVDLLSEAAKLKNQPASPREGEFDQEDQDKLNGCYFLEKAENLANDSYEKFAPKEHTDLNEQITALEAEITGLMEDNKLLSRNFIESKNREITAEEAIDKLRKDLSEDKSEGSYRYSWQSNIAMAFVDEARRSNIKMKVSRKNLHTIANQAAKNFLDSLIK